MVSSNKHSARLPRRLFLWGSGGFFALCLIGGLEILPGLHTVMVHGLLLFWAIIIARYLVLLRFALIPSPVMVQKAPMHTPAVSIILPAYNEDRVIGEAIKSLLDLDYPNFEIIVVDDGSTDNTASAVRSIIAGQSKASIQYIRQRNAGKAVALNTGIKHATGEYLLCIDADSRLSREALHRGLMHFHDPRVGAVGGYVEVANTNRLLTKFQQLEYLISQNFLRRALSRLGAVTVIPGPVGLFRRTALQQLGKP